MIHLAVDGRLSQNLSGLLEGGCGQEGIRSKGRLCNSQHHLLALRRLLSFGDQLLVHLVEFQNAHGGSRKDLGISALLYPYLLKHLADDHLDMLIVDLNALETVNPLYLAEHVVLNGPHALNL